jgi:uncharacterized protein
LSKSRRVTVTPGSLDPAAPDDDPDAALACPPDDKWDGITIERTNGGVVCEKVVTDALRERQTGWTTDTLTRRGLAPHVALSVDSMGVTVRQPTDPLGGWLTITQAAEHLGLSPSGLRALATEKHVEGVQKHVEGVKEGEPDGYRSDVWVVPAEGSEPAGQLTRGRVRFPSAQPGADPLDGDSLDVDTSFECIRRERHVGHPNVELIKGLYDSFAKGEVADMGSAYADDVVLHVESCGVMSGTVHGVDELRSWIARVGEETNGTWQLESLGILADDDQVVALQAVTGQRRGRTIRARQISVNHVTDGKIDEVWWATEDGASFDAFWS